MRLPHIAYIVIDKLKANTFMLIISILAVMKHIKPYKEHTIEPHQKDFIAKLKSIKNNFNFGNAMMFKNECSK